MKEKQAYCPNCNKVVKVLMVKEKFGFSALCRLCKNKFSGTKLWIGENEKE